MKCKKLLAIFLAITCILSTFLCFDSFAAYKIDDFLKPIDSQRPYAENEEIKIVDHVVYYKENDHYTVIDFFDTDEQAASAKTITVTDYIDGLPVTQIKTLSKADYYYDYYEDGEEPVDGIDYSIKKMNISVTQIDLPNTLECIGICAFAKLCGIEYINIPESVNYIAEGAFRGMLNLKRIKIPSKVTTINSSTFRNCYSLYNVDLGSVTEIYYRAFSGCKGLKKITLPNKLKRIGGEAFYHSNLINIDIPQNCTIGDRAFCNTRLSSLTVNGSCTIGESAFANCYNLSTADFSGNKNTVIDIDYGAFADCFRLKSVTFPEKIKELTMRDGIFFNCCNLETVVLPARFYNENKAMSIIDYTFSNCTKLKEIKNTENLVSINDSAFFGCSLLKTYTLSKKFTELGSNTFKNCENLKKLRVLATSTSAIKNNKDAFKNISSDCRIYVKTEKVKTAVVNTGFKGKVIVKADLK